MPTTIATREFIMRLLLAFCLACVATSVAAQWPNKAIKVVVGYAPGGTTDVSARVVGDTLAKALGQSVIIENRPGAAGSIALEAAAKAAADGYTLLVAPDSSLFLPLIKPTVAINVERAFAPIALMTSQPMVILAHPSLGATTLAQLTAALKGAPAPTPYATSSIAGTQNIFAELFFRAAGMRVENIPYKGGGQAVQDVLGGQVKLAVLGTAPVLPHAASGKLNLLAVSTRARSPALPQVPAMSESGYPGIDMTQWFGALAPAGTPGEVVARLNAEINRALADPAVRQRLGAAGLEPLGGSAADMAGRLKAEGATWARAAKEFGIRGE
jgi:tripartite-type tricarboxylate transporter receptor subunit TctC